MAEYAERRRDCGIDYSAYSAISAYSAFYKGIGEPSFPKSRTL